MNSLKCRNISRRILQIFPDARPSWGTCRRPSHASGSTSLPSRATVSCDWWRAGHVTSVLTSDWSAGGGRVRVLQWNHLSQTLGTKGDNFVRCEAAALQWAHR